MTRCVIATERRKALRAAGLQRQRYSSFKLRGLFIVAG